MVPLARVKLSVVNWKFAVSINDCIYITGPLCERGHNENFVIIKQIVIIRQMMVLPDCWDWHQEGTDKVEEGWGEQGKAAEESSGQ